MDPLSSQPNFHFYEGGHFAPISFHDEFPKLYLDPDYLGYYILLEVIDFTLTVHRNCHYVNTQSILQNYQSKKYQVVFLLLSKSVPENENFPKRLAPGME